MLARLLLVGSIAVLALALAPEEPAQITRLLRVAGTYLAEYQRQVSAVVSEELYTQRVRQGGAGPTESRQLKSDLLFVNLGDSGWVGFRDVIEVDGHAVRDGRDRLYKLMTQPLPDSWAQAKRLGEEGARYNLGGVQRTLNMPTVALIFLREHEQGRSSWTFNGMKKIDGRAVAELRFVEYLKPRVIESKDEAPAKGRFWIEPDTGRLVRSELTIDSMGMSAKVTVTFGPAPNVQPWVPLTMDEMYSWSVDGSSTTPGQTSSVISSDGMRSAAVSGTIEGRATYRAFRSFKVDVNAIVRTP